MFWQLLPILLVAIVYSRGEQQQQQQSEETAAAGNAFGNKIIAPTLYGFVEGFRHTTANGTQSNVYLGVPYARPPTGSLRFERPLPPKPWLKPLQTKQFGPACIPYIAAGVRNNVSEDCLYINIITPTKPAKNPLKGYPVLFYIYGGGFSLEDTIRLGYDKATENYIRRNMIVVTVGYRIGVYGFMSLGTDRDPGNMGLWDQIAAMKFVKQNIRFFGGNPNNIIAYGESAGSMSVDFLTLSPHSRNLFQKAIQSSGGAPSYYAIGVPVTKATFRLAKALGCPYTGPTAATKACMQAIPWENILAVSSNTSIFGYGKDSANYLGFGPRYDKDFFDGKTIEELIKEAPPKPVIMGMNTMEGASFTGLRAATPAQRAAYSAVNLTNEFVNKFAPERIAGPEYQAIQQDLINYFVYHDAPENATGAFYIRRFAEFWGDWVVYQGGFNSTDLKVQRGWPIYMYNWNHLTAPVQATLPEAVGGWHAYELYYSFDYHTYPQDVHGPVEIQIQNYYADIFAQFAHTGNPSPSYINFPRYNLQTRKSLWIDPVLSVVSDFLGDRRRFWLEHYGKFNYNIIRGRTRDQIINPASLD